MLTIEHELVLERQVLLAPKVYQLDFYAPSLAASIKAGQFIELQTNKCLKRPFGLMAKNISTGTVSIGVKVVGETTAWLTTRAVGASLRALGPLGNGFKLASPRKIIAVGGGSGLFPLLAALQECKTTATYCALVAGFKSKSEAFLIGELQRYADLAIFASDTGGLDYHGNAIQALNELWQTKPNQLTSALIIACGPKPLLRSVKLFAQKNQLDAQLAVEENMACGLGLCLGCAVKVVNESDPSSPKQVRCCVEGPVFAANSILFEGEG